MPVFIYFFIFIVEICRACWGQRAEYAPPKSCRAGVLVVWVKGEKFLKVKDDTILLSDVFPWAHAQMNN